MSKFQAMSCSTTTSLVLVREVSLEETSILQGSSSVVKVSVFGFYAFSTYIRDDLGTE